MNNSLRETHKQLSSSKIPTADTALKSYESWLKDHLLAEFLAGNLGFSGKHFFDAGLFTKDKDPSPPEKQEDSSLIEEGEVEIKPLGEPRKGEPMDISIPKFRRVFQEMMRFHGLTQNIQGAKLLGFSSTGTLGNLLRERAKGKKVSTQYGKYLIEIMGPEIQD